MNRHLKQIEVLLKRALIPDQRRVKREVHRLIKNSRSDVLVAKTIARLAILKSQLKISVRTKTKRIHNRPAIHYNPDLPIVAKREEIIAAIHKHPVVIIAGETGSGKTTQIPKFCLEAGCGINGLIGCTQPRRIAAITVADRISEELQDTAGQAVGYKIRFQDKTRDTTYIKVMTDGILLAETQTDRYLNAYDTIIVDEAHERSLNIDFILGILKTLISRRKDLKLIITSATIDTEKFSSAFENAPIIEVSGRMFPVEVLYMDTAVDDNDDKSDEATYIDLAAKAVDQIIQREGPFGDILIFMPTEQDIRETQESIEGRNYKGVTVLPLFARLSAQEQARVFHQMAGRKIIVATNIAETSITIPGIKYVIDSGNARISRYSPRTRTTSLPITSISRSSADQRMGRCGRIENGICIRLYSEEDYLARPLFTLPEILRANLAEVILRMIALKIGDIATFPFIDAPQTKNITDGFNILLELGAIKPKKRHPKSIKAKSGSAAGYTLTSRGRLMARLPIDPRLSRILIEGEAQECLKEVAVIVSALSIQDPRERPADKAEEADRLQAPFKHPDSDFLTLLNIWNSFQTHRKNEKYLKRIKSFCKSRLLSFKRMREWLDVHSQIISIIEEHDFDNTSRKSGFSSDHGKEKKDSEGFDTKYTAIHKAVLSGYLSNIATRKEKNVFKAAKGREVMIFPGSSLFNQAHNWIVAAEMVETSKLFARTVANIDSRWLEAIGRYHCKYTYLEPHWEKKRGEVVAFEQVSLFGLIIVSRRPVSFGRIDPHEATRIFIRDALVENDLAFRFDFMRHNQELIEEVRTMEDKVRRRDILISDDDLFAFYSNVIENIYDIRTLKNYLKQKGNDHRLRLKREDIVRCLPPEEEITQFPNDIRLGGSQFKCSYHFMPGEDRDGLTIHIPSDKIGAAAVENAANQIDWLVPGMLKEKIVALLKGLPKSYRRQLVPIADTAETIVAEIEVGDRPLLTALSEHIFEKYNLSIPANAWSAEELPEYLKARLLITDTHGNEIRSSRNKQILQTAKDHLKVGLHGKRQVQFSQAQKKWEQSGLKEWCFKDLPESICLGNTDENDWYVYPGLEAAGQQVDLKLFWDPQKALASHQTGVMRLFELFFSKDLKFLKKNLRVPARRIKLINYFGNPQEFSEGIYSAVLRELFYKNIRTREAFFQYIQDIGPKIFTSGQQKLDAILMIVSCYGEAVDEIKKMALSHRSAPFQALLKTIKEDLDNLIPANFYVLYDRQKMYRIVRYIKAMILRARRASIDFEKDSAKANIIEPYLKSLKLLISDLSTDSTIEKRQAMEEFFWLLEEYKISLFAQELKTHIPISSKRLDKKLAELTRMI